MMEKKRLLGVTILGWSFIIIAILLLFIIPKATFSYQKLFSPISISPEADNWISGLFAYTIISTLIAFLLFLITGIGILKLKRWAYYIALFTPFLYCIGIIKNTWLLGCQYEFKLSTFIWLIINVSIIIFLMNSKVIDQFKADFINKRGKKINPRKYVIWSSILVLVVNVIPIIIWFLAVQIKYAPIVNLKLKPQKVAYRIQDKAFILNNCEKRDIFNYNIYIPKDWKLSTIHRGDSEFGWSLFFVKKDGSELQSLIILNSEGLGKLLFPISKTLNFHTAYDFEKRINYPNWTPIYLILKTISNPKGLEAIDEANTPNWKGFIKVIKNKERNLYDASLYSLKNDKTSGITVLFKGKTITSEQAKSIIASLEFKNIDMESTSLFEKGKNDLANEDFVSATLNFMNALYIDKDNPEFAYYLAFSLFKEADTDVRKARLDCSKTFLEYCLMLSPNYQEAKKLLVLVNNEIHQPGLAPK